MKPLWEKRIPLQTCRGPPIEDTHRPVLRPFRKLTTFRLTFHLSGLMASVGLSLWFYRAASTVHKSPSTILYWLGVEVAFWMTRHLEVHYLEERLRKKVG
ncbi:hypothetical protein BIW11_03813 [Tropilaelaps mercedesae]|uniref:Uncharacterized protein n=1 Tax=Tropilaelaps mercedesae TaxID=418985 RepID=A0A1V9XFE7_9ACAR|nr:hypothetical protein BIW11_03813 [Tropilaelaps mercedesae]